MKAFVRSLTVSASLCLAVGCQSGGTDPAGQGGTDGASGDPSGTGKADAASTSDDDGRDTESSEDCADTDHSVETSSTGRDTSSATSSTGDDPSTGDDTTGDGSPPSFPDDCAEAEFPVWLEGGAGYSTIQGAVDGAPDGTTVFVCPGVYAPFGIQRGVTIVGAGRDAVTIEGGDERFAIAATVPSGSDLSLRGMGVQGGDVGIRIHLSAPLAGHVELANLRVTQQREQGVEVRGLSANLLAEVQMTDVIVTDISDSESSGAGISLRWLTATLTDCVVEDNATTQQGAGMLIDGARVTVIGGRFRRNTAPGSWGGGAFLANGHQNPTPRLTIVGSDWGAGELQENEAEDVVCQQNSFTYPVTWLGANTNVICDLVNGSDCCHSST